VVLSAVVLLGAVLVGWVLGGRLRHLAGVRLRQRRLVPVALAVQLVGSLVGGYRWCLAVAAGLVVAFLVANRHVQGTGLVSLGLLCNALVVGANGAMPVSAEASGRAGVSTQPLLGGGDPRHELASDRTRLRWLADVVPVPLPWRPQVVSPGDVVLAAGLAQLIVVGMRRRPASERQRGRIDSVAGWSNDHHGGHHGQEGPQAPRAQEEQRQPRQAP
jgi:hypothetical protein